MNREDRKKHTMERMLLQTLIVLVVLVSVIMVVISMLIAQSVAMYVIAYIMLACTCVGCILFIRKTISTDGLTGVSNRDAFTKKAVRLMIQKRLPEYTAGFMNISGMKYINQMVGSNGGDLVLRNHAQKIAEILGGIRYICRLGGDNFMFLVKKDQLQDLLHYLDHSIVKIEIPGGMGAEGPAAMDSRAAANFGAGKGPAGKPASGKGMKPKGHGAGRDAKETREVLVPCRLGLYNLTSEDHISDMFNKISIALTYVRREEGAWYKWYEAYMENATYRQKEIIFQFQEALARGEFQVYYQPKIDGLTGNLIGSEALVRWKKEGNLISPMDFIPILEQEGKIMELDFYVFEQACKDLRRQLDSGLKPVPVSSNFSRLHLRDAYFGENILEIITCYHIDKSLIEIELTETASEEDFEALRYFLLRMQDAGIRVSVDDFGVGYSSLELLKNPGFQTVKIDKRFVDNIEKNDGDNNNATLLRYMISTCVNMNKMVLAEGVELPEQREMLVEMGCLEQQGYLYDKPLPVEQYEKWLKAPNFEKGFGARH